MDLLKSIQIFQEVIKHQSFSRAAEQLGLVPSAVSRQVTELEKRLGIRLLQRTTRSLRLTEEGQRYLSQMQRIQEQVDALDGMQDDEGQIRGRISLTAPTMLGQFALPQALAEFKRQYPEVQFTMALMNRKVDLVEEGFDLAVRGGHLDDANFIARPLGVINLKTVASPDYLAAHPPIRHPRDLVRHSCLLHNAVAGPNRWRFNIDGKTSQIKVSGEVEANDSLWLRAFAEADQGVAHLPGFHVDEALAAGRLVEILDEFAPPPLPLNLIYPSQRLMSPTLRRLVDFLVDRLRRQISTPPR